MAEEISVQILTQASDNIQKLFDLTTRVDERVKNICVINEQLNKRIDGISQQQQHCNQSLAVIESKQTSFENNIKAAIDITVREAAREIAEKTAREAAREIADKTARELVEKTAINLREITGEKAEELKGTTHELAQNLKKEADELRSLVVGVEKRLVIIEMDSGKHNDRWNRTVTFGIQLVWVCLAAWLLMKFNLQPPAVP